MQNTPILALTASATACYEKEMEPGCATMLLLSKPKQGNTFSKVLPRGNREDRKLITVMKVFICNITQTKANLLTNYFQKQFANLVVSATCYFKQEHCKQQFEFLQM